MSQKDYNLFSNPRNYSRGGVTIYVSKFHSPTCIRNIIVMECEIESDLLKYLFMGTIYSRLYAEVGSSALHVAVAALHFRQCSGSARFIFK